VYASDCGERNRSIPEALAGICISVAVNLAISISDGQREAILRVAEHFRLLAASVGLISRTRHQWLSAHESYLTLPLRL
jgi:hypothetical protein